MDPQGKMALQCSWEAVERAGVDLKAYHNERIGVYFGSQVGARQAWQPPNGPGPFSASSTPLSMIANRVSFHLNLTGPSFGCNTACSSGVTAVHLASVALRGGECVEALAGAGSYLGNIFGSIAFGKLGVMSPTGRCHSFDSRANGYQRAEGVTVFVMKERARAERDGDMVHLAILSTEIACAGAEPDAAYFSAGRTITKPVSDSQAELMARTLRGASVGPDDIAYLEAHCTGTPVGDGVEGVAIANLFGNRDGGKLRIASTRTNLGHQESSSFTSSLLKMVIMCRNRTFYPISTNYETLNPAVPFDNKDTLCIQTKQEKFPALSRDSEVRR